MATQLLEGRQLEPLKHRDSKLKRAYACAVTVCIGAICSEGENQLIILCSDQKLSYGEGSPSADIGFKLDLAGAGWAAMMAGGLSNAHGMVSFYRNHLNSVKLTIENYQREFKAALSSYREWLADQYVRHNYFTTLEKVLRSKPSNLPGLDKERILKEARSERFEEQLILSGYIEGSPILIRVSAEGVEECKHFSTIGTGAWLAQAALLQREYSSAKEIEEAFYLIYEAKRFSEKENSVGGSTVLLVQEPPLNPADPALTLRTVSPHGLLHLEDQYLLFGLQPYQQIPYKQPKRFYI